jgi:vacuolar protein sorting-associated protein 16
MASQIPLACNLLEVYLGQQETDLLRDFYYQNDKRTSSANLIVRTTLTEPNDVRIPLLKAASKLYYQDKATIEHKVNDGD